AYCPSSVLDADVQGVGSSVVCAFVLGGGADGVGVGPVGVGVGRRGRVARHHLGVAVAPVDGPALDGVGAGVSGGEAQRVGGALRSGERGGGREGGGQVRGGGRGGGGG